MLKRMSIFTIVLAVFFILDFYLFQGVKTLSTGLSNNSRTLIHTFFWGIALFNFCSVMYLLFYSQEGNNNIIRNFIITWLLANMIVKLVFFFFLFIDDIQRFVRWVI